VRPEETVLNCHSPLVFTRYRGGLLLFTLFLTISLMIVKVSLAASLGGQGGIRNIAHEFRNIVIVVIDLFLAPYTPLGIGDVDHK